MEHDITFDTATNTILKFTKPDKAAYAVSFDLGTPKLVPATPLEYMERLKLQNSVFDDTLRFLGMATDDGVIVPIDCIPVRLPLGKRAFFEM